MQNFPGAHTCIFLTDKNSYLMKITDLTFFRYLRNINVDIISMYNITLV